MGNNEYAFISYSRQDQEFVNRLSSDLRKLGISVWVDTENISPGTSWEQEIETGLRNASSLIFVISKGSLKSQWMIRELSLMSNLRKKILPIIIQDINVSELPLEIRQIQFADFRKSYTDGFNNLLKGLQYITKSLEPLPTPTTKSKGYVFISYAEEDTDFAKTLREFFKKKNYAYWDYQESDRDYHNQLSLELEGIIREASATLSILSESWKLSQWASREYFFSEEVGTPVFLLKAKPMSPSLATAGKPFIDFTKDFKNGIQKLEKELDRKNL